MCIYVLQGICITLSRDKSLTSNNSIRFGSTLMPLFPHDSGGILKIQTIYITCKFMYGHPTNICCDKKSDIHETKLIVNTFIILGYVNDYGINRYL